MGKNKNATKALTQEEIWDDSALVQSWDEAVEEYKVPSAPSETPAHVICISNTPPNSSTIASTPKGRMSRMY